MGIEKSNAKSLTKMMNRGRGGTGEGIVGGGGRGMVRENYGQVPYNEILSRNGGSGEEEEKDRKNR